MLSIHVIACVAMLPSMVVSARYFLGGCGLNFDKYDDPIAHTQQGSMTVDDFFANGAGSVYLWNPHNNEKDFTNMMLSSSTPGQYTLEYTDDSGTATQHNMEMEYQFTPKMEMKFTTTAQNGQFGIFSLGFFGDADLYPVYISSTDLILRGCAAAFAGRLESLYVMTNQDYSSLDADCAIQSIKETYGWDVEVHTQ